METNGKQNGANGHAKILQTLFDADSVKAQFENGNSAPSVFSIQPENFESKDPSDGSNKKYRKTPYEYIDPVWQIGWTDGRYGQSPSNNEEVLEVEGSLRWYQRLETVEAGIAKRTGRVAALTSTRDWLQPKLQATAQAFKQLSEQRQENFQDFSRQLGFFYAVFAILLLAGDIPLSLRLVAAGIGVTTWFTEDHHKYTLDDIFLNGSVLSHLWEAILLAIGIAALGVFIKFFLDTVVFRENEKKAPSVLVVAMMTFTLCLLLSSIVVLGVYRAEQQQQAQRQAVAEKIRQKHQQNINTGVEKEMPADIDTQIAKAVNDVPKESRWQSATFIALTLLLPLIAGFCFSASGRKLRNAYQYRTTKATLKEMEDQFRGITEELCEAEQDLQFQKDRLKRESDSQEFRNAIVSLPRLIYLHGYERGRNVPETLEEGASLYERCLKTVEKLLAKKLRTKLWAPISGSK